MSDVSHRIGETHGGGILVLEARPSTLDFTLFAVDAKGGLLRTVDGGLDRLYADARFHAEDAAGRTVIDVDCADESPPGHGVAVKFLFNWLEQCLGAVPLLAVGHHVVHGGPRFSGPTRIDPSTLRYLHALVPLAPARQRPCLLAIRIIARRWPALPQVACFETAFYRRAPMLQDNPLGAVGKRGSRRDGYDGLSFECVIDALPAVDERAAQGKTIIVHVGEDASLCALDAGRKIAMATGFGALAGPSGTLHRQLDRGGAGHLMAEARLRQQSKRLEASGLAEDLDQLVDNNEPHARLAVELLVYCIGRELGSLAAALAGLDTIVFTAAAGPHAVPIRAEICGRASWLGVDLDPAANRAGGPRLTRPGSRVAAWAIPVDTPLLVARRTQAVIDALSGSG